MNDKKIMEYLLKNTCGLLSELDCCVAGGVFSDLDMYGKTPFFGDADVYPKNAYVAEAAEKRLERGGYEKLHSGDYATLYWKKGFPKIHLIRSNPVDGSDNGGLRDVISRFDIGPAQIGADADGIVRTAAYERSFDDRIVRAASFEFADDSDLEKLKTYRSKAWLDSVGRTAKYVSRKGYSYADPDLIFDLLRKGKTAYENHREKEFVRVRDTTVADFKEGTSLGSGPAGTDAYSSFSGKTKFLTRDEYVRAVRGDLIVGEDAKIPASWRDRIKGGSAFDFSCKDVLKPLFSGSMFLYGISSIFASSIDRLGAKFPADLFDGPDASYFAYRIRSETAYVLALRTGPTRRFERRFDPVKDYPEVLGFEERKKGGFYLSYGFFDAFLAAGFDVAAKYEAAVRRKRFVPSSAWISEETLTPADAAVFAGDEKAFKKITAAGGRVSDILERAVFEGADGPVLDFLCGRFASPGEISL